MDRPPTSGWDERAKGTASETGDNASPARDVGSSSGGACDTAANWEARNDLAFESAGTSDFAETVNALIRASDGSPIAVSSHVDARCVWSVAFSAPDGADAPAGARHPATYATMLRHPMGLWTAAPQSSGWLRIADAAMHTIWIPISDVTGSATYGETACATLSKVRVSASISSSAGPLAFATARGVTTLGVLLGPESFEGGWQVQFTFSAVVTR